MAEPANKLTLDLLDLPRAPYEGLPADATMKAVQAKLSAENPVGIAQAAYEAMVLQRSEPTPKFNPGMGMTPRQFEMVLKRHEKKTALIDYKRSIYPMVKVYVADMEAHPDLAQRNSIAAAVILAMFFTDEFRAVTKHLNQLISIFGHSNVTVTTKRDPTSIEERLKAITMRQIQRIRQVGCNAELIDAGSSDREAAGVPADRRLAAGSDVGPGTVGAAASG